MKAAQTLSQLKRSRGLVKDNRPNAAKRGYGSRWRRARDGHLRANPLCAECTREGITTIATLVDHIDPPKGDIKKFWDRDNWQSLCTPHHNRKTARQDGGFGNISKERKA